MFRKTTCLKYGSMQYKFFTTYMTLFRDHKVFDVKLKKIYFAFFIR